MIILFWAKSKGFGDFWADIAAFDKKEGLADEIYYVISDDSTTITLSAEYLDQLSGGTYSIEIVSTNGIASTNLIVLAGLTMPQTVMICGIAVGVLAIGIIVVVVISLDRGCQGLV